MGTPASAKTSAMNVSKVCAASIPIKKSRFQTIMSQDGPYLLMLVIPITYFLIFCYGPMYGLIISFQNYQIGSGYLVGAKWVGLKWFQDFFASPFCFRLIRNTVLISLYNIIFEFPLPIILAMIFNEIRSKHLKGFAQTVSYLPHFLSVAIVVGILKNFLSVNGGIVNDLLFRLGLEKVDFMQNAGWFRSLYVGSGIWQQIGFGSIIYVAAIAGISPTLYEAAFVDGSTRFKNFYLITLPSIAPTIIIMLILRIGSVMSVGYEKIILMYSPPTYDTADAISTYVYRTGIVGARFSYATAIGLFNSVVNVTLLVSANYISRKLTDNSLW